MAQHLDTRDISSTDPVPGSDTPPHGHDAPDLQVFVFVLFFVFGGITSLNDVLIPKLKELFTLSYAQAMLVQSAFFAAYFIVSIPAARVVRHYGYLRTAALGVAVMAAGCLLFIPASQAGVFSLFLLALFIVAAGITTVQVVANPLISLLGTPRTAHSRLTFAQAFNSLGTTIFPYVGSLLILAPLAGIATEALQGESLLAYRQRETAVVSHTYMGLAAALVVLAGLIWMRRHRLQDRHAATLRWSHAIALLGRARFGYGVACIFLYVGAEVAIGSLIVNFLMQPSTLGLDAQSAGTHVPFYWGGALVGRFIGAALLRLVSPGKVLAAAASASVVLLLTALLSEGAVSGWALLAIGLCNSIMFPTIFSLACEGLGARAADGSGILCVAIVGGAIIPPLTGHLADLFDLRLALLLPAACYALIAAYGVYARRSVI
jgi:FHS family L-fucose permease-like MFS transporter